MRHNNSLPSNIHSTLAKMIQGRPTLKPIERNKFKLSPGKIASVKITVKTSGASQANVLNKEEEQVENSDKVDDAVHQKNEEIPVTGERDS